VPLYMDIHRLDEIDPAALASAHDRDLEVQERYGVDYKDFWFSENPATVFCLVEAPSPEAAESVHREAHGLVADEIVEVKPGASA
jgi:hypothetical protein